MTCFEVPKTWELVNGQIVMLPLDPSRLRTLEEMLEDGFDRRLARISINAVRARLRKAAAAASVKMDGEAILDAIYVEPMKI